MLKQIPKSIEEATKMFESGDITPTQLVEHYFAVIKEKNPTLNAVLETFEDAKEAAKVSEENFKNKKTRPLEGIPFLVKDCILVKGHIASAGSQMLKNYIAPYDATAIRLIKEAGGIILGRTNMDEFALGGSGENSSYGKTLNALDPERVPGGSSSGSAAALSAGMCLVSLGTDTGGSIRQPASFCGLFGLKPSYGSTSRSGLIAAASSLEGIGVFGNCIEDVKKVFEVINKEDKLDNKSMPQALREELAKKLKNKDPKLFKKIVYPKSYVENKGISEEVKRNFYENVEKLKQKGFSVEPVEIETLRYALSMYYILNTAEVSTNLSRMDGLRFGGGPVDDVRNYQDLFAKNRGKYLGPEVKRRIMLGSYVLSHGYYDAFYGKANILRAQMQNEFSKIFDAASIVILPTAPTTAWKSGEVKDPLTLYLEDIFTVPANLVGIPGISIPSGFDSNKMPFSLQALANFGEEETLFDFSKAFLS